MASFFGAGKGESNPFATHVGQLIERSTDPVSPNDNIELFFEITDLINDKEEHAKDAIRAIRKKLSIYGGKNWSVVMKVLVLLETCSNNCTKRFQVQLASKDFLSELKGMIQPKMAPPLNIQEKVLYLIQHWATIFKGDVDFKNIEALYTELRTKGIDFPVYDPESVSLPSFASDEHKSGSSNGAAAAAAGADVAPKRKSQSPPVSPGATQQQPTRRGVAAAAVVKLNEDQAAKLNSELDVVDCNVQVFNDILTALQSSVSAESNPAQIKKKLLEQKKEIDLTQELNRTCQDMQARVAQLIGNVSNEAIINELLRVNDDLNNVFLRYERFEKSLGSVGVLPPHSPPKPATTTTASVVDPPSATLSSPSGAAAAPAPRSTSVEEKPLIDFGADFDMSTSKQTDHNARTLANMSLNEKKKPGKGTPSESLDDLEENSFLHDEAEIKEMESWLNNQVAPVGGNNAAADGASSNNNNASRAVKSDEKSMFAL